jgi:hypothetical protein
MYQTLAARAVFLFEIGEGVFTFGEHRTPKTEGRVEKLERKSRYLRLNARKNTSPSPPKVKNKYKYKYKIYVFIDAWLVLWVSFRPQ